MPNRTALQVVDGGGRSDVGNFFIQVHALKRNFAKLRYFARQPSRGKAVASPRSPGSAPCALNPVMFVSADYEARRGDVSAEKFLCSAWIYYLV